VFGDDASAVEYLRGRGDCQELVEDVFNSRSDHAALTICLNETDSRGTIAFVFNPKQAHVKINEQIAHEVHHAFQRLMALIDEQDPGVELPAYMVGYITSQVYQKLANIRKEHARKRPGSVPEKASPKKRGPKPKVGKPVDDGGAGPDRAPPKKASPRRTKDAQGGDK
jgi:hypothetical protein